MNVLEKEIEELVYEASINNRDELRARGLHIGGFVFRQPNFGRYGIADLVSVERIGCRTFGRTLNITIYELKKDMVNNSTFLQALRYAKAIDRIITGRYEWVRDYFEINYYFVLIGKEVEMKGDFCYMPDFFPVKILTYSVDLIKGVVFTNHNRFFLHQEDLPEIEIEQDFKRSFLLGGI